MVTSRTDRSEYQRGGDVAIRIVNTFSPHVPIFSSLSRAIRDRNIRLYILQSKAAYRDLDQTKFEGLEGQAAGKCVKEFVWVPGRLAGETKWCHMFFAAVAPFVLSLRPKTLHVFLTMPPLFFVLGAAMARLRGVPYVVHIMDMYPEILANVGILKRESYVYKALMRLRTNALEHAQKIVVIGRCMKDDLLCRGITEEKLQYFPNWTHDKIVPVSKKENRFLKKYGLEGLFVVMYSGNMGTGHEFGTILDVAGQLIGQQDILFVFVGGGRRRSEVAEARSAGLNNVLLLQSQPLELLSDSLSAGDVHFVSLRAGFEGTMVPSKFYGVAAAGRPVIYEGSEYGEIARIIKEFNCGTVVANGDRPALKDAILEYKERVDIYDEKRRNAERFHRIQTGVERGKEYLEMLDSILLPSCGAVHGRV